jgi:organic hydroperoxide reductase OsmC/OhrA
MTGNEYRATVVWHAGGADFLKGRYSRAHRWLFEGVEVPASASPLHVPPPLSRADAVDPEEGFIAALSSCHMLFFLYFAAKAGLAVESYEDDAVGTIGENERGKHFVATVLLNPRIAFSGARQPSEAEIAELHHKSHEECYLANSVLTKISVAGLSENGGAH